MTDDRRGGDAPGTDHADVSRPEDGFLSHPNRTVQKARPARWTSAGRAPTSEADHDAHAAMLDRLTRMLWQAKHGAGT